MTSKNLVNSLKQLQNLKVFRKLDDVIVSVQISSIKQFR